MWLVCARGCPPGFRPGLKKVNATKVAQSFRLRALRYAETGGAAKPRDKMFHLAGRQMKLTRNRAERRGWMRASQEAQHFLAPGETRGHNHARHPTTEPRLRAGWIHAKGGTSPGVFMGWQ